MFNLKTPNSRSSATAKAGEAKRLRENDRGRRQSAQAREIGPLPPVADSARRELCRMDLRKFEQTYFQKVFTKPPSSDHDRETAKQQRTITEGGTYAFADPRGDGKTSRCFVAIIWAIVYGYSRFTLAIGATEGAADQILQLIKSALANNDLLASDFPEICVPIRALERDARRCAGQTVDGQRTQISWTAHRLILPIIAGSVAAGAIIGVAGIGGRIRGNIKGMADGSVARPDLVLVDDFQTSESAYSDEQCNDRLNLLHSDILGLAAPGKRIACFCACTVIRAGDAADRLLNRKLFPSWQGERSKLIYTWPVATDLWDQYAEIRAQELEAGGDGSKATHFYRLNREAMDTGARVGWPERFNADELSAIQHAVNLKLRDPVAFASEYQNEPLLPTTATAELKPEVIQAKCNGFARYHLPTDAHTISAMIDVHDGLLYYAVCGWTQEDATGFLIDYGTYPDQQQRYFTLRDANKTLQKAAPGMSKEAAILAGLNRLSADLFGRSYTRDDGAALTLNMLLIDSGYLPQIVAQFIRTCGRTGVMASRGIGITASAAPMSLYPRRQGELNTGREWIISKPAGSNQRVCRFDANHFKTFVADRLARPIGEKGALSLFGNDPHLHRLIAEQLTAEYSVETEGRGRRLQEWRMRPGKVDNHLGDAVVGCAVAASVLGVGVAARPKAFARRRPRVTYLDGPGPSLAVGSSIAVL